MAQLHNPHPGEILKEEFLKTIGMSQNQLAQAIRVPGNRIHAIVNGTRAITGDADLRLCKFFGLSEGYFLRLQNTYDTLEAKRRIAAELAKIKRYKPRDKADGRDHATFGVNEETERAPFNVRFSGAPRLAGGGSGPPPLTIPSNSQI